MNQQQRKLIAAEVATLTAQQQAIEALLEGLPLDSDEASVSAALVTLLANADMLKTATGSLDDIYTFFENMRDDEEEKFDNLSEGLQGAESGQKLEAAKDELDNAANAVDDAKRALEEGTDSLVGGDFIEDSEKVDAVKASLRETVDAIETAVDAANDASV